MIRIRKASLLLLYFSTNVTCRSWSKIEISQNVDIRENYLEKERTEADPFDYDFPTASDAPNIPGTKPIEPRPCEGCDEIDPRDYPSSYQTNPVPLNPPRGYFNYDVSRNARYGPGYPSYYQYGNEFRIRYENNAWGNVQKIDNFDYYWDEFGGDGIGWGAWKGVLANHNMVQSVCSSGNNQSPIDIRLSGVACVETHQIRHRVSHQSDSLKNIYFG